MSDIFESDEENRQLERKFASGGGLSFPEKIKLFRFMKSQGKLLPRQKKEITLDKQPSSSAYNYMQNTTRRRNKIANINNNPNTSQIDSMRAQQLGQRADLRFNDLYDRTNLPNSNVWNSPGIRKRQDSDFKRLHGHIEKTRRNLKTLNYLKKLGITQVPNNVLESDEEKRSLERKIVGGSATLRERLRLYNLKKALGELEPRKQTSRPTRNPLYQHLNRNIPDVQYLDTHKKFITRGGKINNEIDKKREDNLEKRMQNFANELLKRSDVSIAYPDVPSVAQLRKGRLDLRRDAKKLRTAKRLGLDDLPIGESDEEKRTLERKIKDNSATQFERKKLLSILDREGKLEPRASKDIKLTDKAPENYRRATDSLLHIRPDHTPIQKSIIGLLNNLRIGRAGGAWSRHNYQYNPEGPMAINMKSLFDAYKKTKEELRPMLKRAQTAKRLGITEEYSKNEIKGLEKISNRMARALDKDPNNRILANKYKAIKDRLDNYYWGEGHGEEHKLLDKTVAAFDRGRPVSKKRGRLLRALINKATPSKVEQLKRESPLFKRVKSGKETLPEYGKKLNADSYSISHGPDNYILKAVYKDSNEHDWHLFNKDNNKIGDFAIEPKNRVVKWSGIDIDSKLRGSGLAKKAYATLAKHYGDLTSDTESTSQSAYRIYNSLKKHGWAQDTDKVNDYLVKRMRIKIPNVEKNISKLKKLRESDEGIRKLVRDFNTTRDESIFKTIINNLKRSGQLNIRKQTKYPLEKWPSITVTGYKEEHPKADNINRFDDMGEKDVRSNAIKDRYWNKILALGRRLSYNPGYSDDTKNQQKWSYKKDLEFLEKDRKIGKLLRTLQKLGIKKLPDIDYNKEID